MAGGARTRSQLVPRSLELWNAYVRHEHAWGDVAAAEAIENRRKSNTAKGIELHTGSNWKLRARGPCHRSGRASAQQRSNREGNRMPAKGNHMSHGRWLAYPTALDSLPRDGTEPHGQVPPPKWPLSSLPHCHTAQPLGPLHPSHGRAGGDAGVGAGGRRAFAQRDGSAPAARVQRAHP
eukprot:7377285-Prymnesium_polylepis.1